MNDKTQASEKPDAGETQSDHTTEASKPEDGRAKGSPKAGNILGSVQPK